MSPNGRLGEGLTEFASLMQVHSVLPISSGRAALWGILRGLHRLRPDRVVVALPSYLCFSVPASIIRARLRLYPVDVDPETLDFDFSQLEAIPGENLLCILTSNLFGLVNDLSRIQAIAQTKGAFMVDDAAQALGASRGARLAGTGGDVGFYSFGRGKPLSAGEGGLIIAKSEDVTAAIRAELDTLLPSPASHSAWLFLQMLAYSVFLNPRLYWIPNSLPFLKLGVTEFAPDFPVRSLPGLVQALFPELLKGLLEFNRIRRKNAATITQALAGSHCFSTPHPAADCQPTYIRFPVIAKDQSTRDLAVFHLRAAGIGASAFYPAAICDIAGIEPYMFPKDFHREQAEALSRRLLTLPTHPFVRHLDIDRMAEVLSRF